MSPMSERDLEVAYKSHVLEGTSSAVYGVLKGMCKGLATWVLQNFPDCRERALFFTKLEEASMWAGACVARNQSHWGAGDGPGGTGEKQ